MALRSGVRLIPRANISRINHPVSRQFVPIVGMRHNSTLPTLVSYMKDKGIYIPASKKILSESEYKKYELYRQIKLGDHVWLNEHLSSSPPGDEEKDSLIEYVNDLKKQPYSIPNFFIGYVICKSSIMSFYYAAAGLTQLSPGIPFFAGVSLTAVVGGISYNFLKHGLKICVDEFKSPYYNYDEMLRICKKYDANSIVTEKK
jgi:hypothetical protein